MTDSTLDLTQPLHTAKTLIKIIDNGDGTYAVNISGDVTATLSATDNSVLDAIVAQLQGISPVSKVIYDTIKVSYTDATKATISKVEYMLGVAVVLTLTPTFAATSDTWVRS